MSKYEEEIIRMLKNLNNELIHILLLKKDLQSRLSNINYIDNDDLLIDKFEITNDMNDKILNDELRKIIKTENNHSLKKLKRNLKLLGAMDYKTKTLRGLRGIKLKINN